MANRKGTPESLGVTPLAEGEHSRPVRVRAEAWVFEALKGRSAAEVGALLASALRLDPVVSLVEQHESQPTVLHASTAKQEPAPVPSLPKLPKALLDIVASLEAGCTAEFDYGVRKWVVSGKGQWYEVRKGELTKLVKAGLIQEERGRYRVTR